MRISSYISVWEWFVANDIYTHVTGDYCVERKSAVHDFLYSLCVYVSLGGGGGVSIYMYTCMMIHLYTSPSVADELWIQRN